MIIVNKVAVTMARTFFSAERIVYIYRAVDLG